MAQPPMPFLQQVKCNLKSLNISPWNFCSGTNESSGDLLIQPNEELVFCKVRENLIADLNLTNKSDKPCAFKVHI